MAGAVFRGILRIRPEYTWLVVRVRYYQERAWLMAVQPGQSSENPATCLSANPPVQSKLQIPAAIPARGVDAASSVTFTSRLLRGMGGFVAYLFSFYRY